MNQVIAGIKKCSEINKIPETVAIDTWGVDYVLIDANETKFFRLYRTAITELTVFRRKSEKYFLRRICMSEQVFKNRISIRCISFTAIKNQENSKRQNIFFDT